MADHVLTRWHWQDRQVSQARPPRLMHVMRARGLRLSRNAVEQRCTAAWLVGLESLNLSDKETPLALADPIGPTHQSTK